MMKPVIRITSLAAVFAGIIFGQVPPTARFEIADLSVSPPSVSYSQRSVSGGLLPGGRYDLRRATMLDLIAAAWAIDPEKVLGGPSRLDMHRFDVCATAPAGTSGKTVGPLLQALLQERFHLILHNEVKSVPVFALKAGTKHKLIRAAVSGPAGCSVNYAAESADPAAPSETLAKYTCHNMTMEALPRNWPVPTRLTVSS
jgi:uncharacterized protein (TIGR03435 family)